MQTCVHPEKHAYGNHLYGFPLTLFLSHWIKFKLHSSSLQAEAVRRVMSELNLTVVEMGAEEGDSGGATLEGSDVLFTGREFFVGISSHTNRRGAEVLADTFRVRKHKAQREDVPMT